jgi:GDP-4-dehydro-6-deoxy-D-mannose reductase
MYPISMSKILVTGVNGFVGQHLAKELSESGNQVMGVGGAQGHKGESPYIQSYMELDLTKAEEASKIDFNDVDGVIHLAGLTNVGQSFDDPLLYVNVNVGIEVNLYEAALKQNSSPRFLIVSSGTLYDSKAPLPLNEESSVDPNSPYAVSKIGQEQMAMYYHSRGFDCIIVRPFNHIGPGQGPGFIVPDLAQQIVSFEKGETSSISVGNLDSQRDYSDVRDIVKAYRLLISKGKSGETYNICSGKAISGHQLLEGLLSHAEHKPEIKQDPSKMRPSDAPIIYGSHDKLTRDTGWQPEIPLEKTLEDVMSDWRNRA